MEDAPVIAGLLEKRADLERAIAKLERQIRMRETEASVNSKLVRGTFAVTFFLAVLAVLELEGVRLEDL